MIVKSIKELKGNEILAKPIMTWDYQMILPEGAVLKKEYIDKIFELGILEVFVKEEAVPTNEIVILKSNVESSVKEKVKDIMKHKISIN